MASTPNKSSKRSLVFSPGASANPKTPKLNGRSVDYSGPIVFVGHVSKSQSGNLYFDLRLQINSTSYKEVRMMRQTDERLKLIESVGKIIHFRNVSEDGKLIFFNKDQGALFSIEEKKPSLKIYSFVHYTTAISKIITANKEGVIANEMYNMHVKLHFVGTEKRTLKGNKWKSCVLYDLTGAVYCAVWRESVLTIEEDKWLFLTNMTVEDNFGFKMNTTQNTTYMLSGATDALALPDLEQYIIRASGAASAHSVNIEGFSGVSLVSKTHCSSNTCSGSLTVIDNFMGKCDQCPRKCVLKRCRSYLLGQIDAEDLTLSIDEFVIDQIFGAGTAETHRNNIADLEMKLFLLENINVTFDGKSKKIIAIKQN